MFASLEYIDIIGFIAAILGTFSLVPQVIKILKSRTTLGVSMIMYLIICIDSALWLIYGLVLSLKPLIIQSSIILICAFTIVVMKLIWK